MTDRFRLDKSTRQPNWWVLTDTEHDIVIRFEEHRFNETQEVTLLNGDKFKTQEEAVAYTRYLREMGDWLVANHSDLAFPLPTYTMEGNTIVRNKYPRMTISIEDDADARKIADALKKAAEYIIKRKNYE